MEAGTIMGGIIGVILSTILNSIAIYIVGKLGLGITIKNFGTAILAGLLTAVFGVLIFSFTDTLTAGGTPWIGHLLHLLISAIIILIIARILSGMEAKGFLGAFVAAAAIALLFYLVGLVMGG